MNHCDTHYMILLRRDRVALGIFGWDLAGGLATQTILAQFKYFQHTRLKRRAVWSVTSPCFAFICYLSSIYEDNETESETDFVARSWSQESILHTIGVLQVAACIFAILRVHFSDMYYAVSSLMCSTTPISFLACFHCHIRVHYHLIEKTRSLLRST